MIQIYEAKQIAPPLDEGLDNLARFLHINES